MTRICTICARGGSKGVPGKNIRSLAGKPLIAWTIEQAKQSALFDLIAVSSDASDILDVARHAGADLAVVRPDALASDTAAKIPAIEHCLRAAEDALGRQCDIFADLDATSPLRTISDIKGAVKLLEDNGVSSVITGSKARRSPYFNLVELDKAGRARLSKKLDEPVVRRQDAPRCYDMNASIYVWQRDAFINRPSVFYPDTLLFEMPEERSIDIDSDIDFQFVEMLFLKSTGKGVAK